MDILDERANEVCERAMAEESSARHHVVIALTGAHAYGFPSPDSDLDLKAIHIEKTERLLGLARSREVADRLEVIDGVEIDYTSNEIRPALAGILAGNGNYIERILGELIWATSPEHEALKPLVERSLSRRVYKHYRGFASSQRHALDEAEQPTAKKLLYVLRTALTGAHLLRTGELRVDLSTVAGEYGFGHAAELIETKRRGELVPLTADQYQSWQGDLDRLFALLDQSLEDSCLPVEPSAGDSAALESWLIEVRRQHL